MTNFRFSTRLRLCRCAWFILVYAIGLVQFSQAQAITGIHLPGASYANVIFDSAGNLYGTTNVGGSGNCKLGCGVIFELQPVFNGWTETVLYNFTGGDDGYNPAAGLVFDATGNLYGTTNAGGTKDCGVVFELSPGTANIWTEKVLHNFTCGTDGGHPSSPLTFDRAGHLYGTTLIGGLANGCFLTGCGVIYQLSKKANGDWQESVLHTFTGKADGFNAGGSLLLDGEGNLIGATALGGDLTVYGGYGLIYKLVHSSGIWREISLHTFHGLSDGFIPNGSLVFDSSGNLYGTAQGGTYSQGLAFKLVPTASGRWQELPIYNFTGGTDGALATSGLTFDKKGNLYGTTDEGNPNGCSGWGCGQVFELSPNTDGTWGITTLYPLGQSIPAGGLTVDASGNIYGTYFDPRNLNYGSAFQIVP